MVFKTVIQNQTKMVQLKLPLILWNHVYPGIFLTFFFILLAPYFYHTGIPPQLALLIGVPVVLVPALYIHLKYSAKEESLRKIKDLIVYNSNLPKLTLFIYVFGLVFFSFLVYGLTQPLNSYFDDHLLQWLPDWYKIQDFDGYSKNIIILTLFLNLFLNGFLAPVAEEIYFRGYLLPRMERLHHWAPAINTLMFSFYHFWQPQIFLTLIISLFPMTYLTWKTKCLKLAIYTHCALNIVGAILSFGMLIP